MKKIETLEERKQIFLGICDAVDKFCRKNNIKYFIAYGTLIGAIRHKGFIPWDDDLDIMMLRDDYENFTKIFKDSRYKLVNCYNDKGYNFQFARVYDTQTCWYKKGIKSNGIGIDVYIVDKVPTDESLTNKYIKNVAHCVRKRLFCIKIRNLLQKFNLWFSKNNDFCPLNYYCRKQDAVCKQYDSIEEFNYICNAGGADNKKILNKILFNDTIDVDFEGRKYMAPKEYDSFLRQVYGDYMQLPPEDQRQPYHSSLNLYWIE